MLLFALFFILGILIVPVWIGDESNNITMK